MASSNKSKSANSVGFQIHPKDNVATMLQSVGLGSATIHCNAEEQTLMVQEPIEMGHKVAIKPIADGDNIVKYGVAIGVATAPITPGNWVHLHNCKSRLDERSNALDLHTGLPEDIRYE